MFAWKNDSKKGKTLGMKRFEWGVGGGLCRLKASCQQIDGGGVRGVAGKQVYWRNLAIMLPPLTPSRIMIVGMIVIESV